MPTDLENLQQARSDAISNLAAVEAAGPKATYKIDGEFVDWNTYARVQQEKIRFLDELLANGGTAPTGPFEYTQIGYTG